MCFTFLIFNIIISVFLKVCIAVNNGIHRFLPYRSFSFNGVFNNSFKGVSVCLCKLRFALIAVIIIKRILCACLFRLYFAFVRRPRNVHRVAFHTANSLRVLRSVLIFGGIFVLLRFCSVFGLSTDIFGLSTIFRFKHFKVCFIFVYEHRNIFRASKIIAAVFIRSLLFKLEHNLAVFVGIFLLKLCHITVFKLLFEHFKISNHTFNAFFLLIRARFRAHGLFFCIRRLFLRAHGFFICRKMLIAIFFKFCRRFAVFLTFFCRKLPELVVIVFRIRFNRNNTVLCRFLISFYKRIYILAAFKHISVALVHN